MTQYEGKEKRFEPRWKANTEVKVVAGKNKKICRCENISATGCAIHTEDMGLKKNQRVELMFMVKSNGITKLHKRMAIVIYIKNGITGFVMGAHGAYGDTL